jgi:hypothetical protein
MSRELQNGEFQHRRQRSSELRMLLKLIKRESCVLVLGPRIAVRASDPRGPTLDEVLIAKLHGSLTNSPAEKPSSLHAAAELHYKEYGTTRLELEVEDFYSTEREATTEFHRDLAKLPFRLCISASPDNMMLNAFKGVPKRPQMDYYPFQDNKRGKNAALVAATVERPIVYHVFGHHEEGASLVLREADIIDHLVQIIKGEPPIPDQVRSVLKESGGSFLFLGFGFHNWYLRVLLKVLEVYGPGDKIAFEDDGFFDLPEGKHAIAFFSGDRDRRIDFRHLHWDTFARQLRENYEEGLPAVAAPAAPTVPNAPLAFLSYASEDYEVVDQLQQNLESSGINIWRDKQNLRAGTRWKSALQAVIKKQADYVIVVQTSSMTKAISGVFNWEIEEARQREAEMGAFGDQKLSFLLPVMADDCPVLSSLEEFHRIDVRNPEGMNRLVQSIKQDWEIRQKKLEAV